EAELKEIKNQDNLSKIIISFIELKNNVLVGKDYHNQLQELELLSGANSDLSVKVKRLKIILNQNPKTQAQIKAEFANLIQQIIAKKSEEKNKENKLYDKVKNNLNKLVIIRKTNGAAQKEQENIDLIVLKTEESIEESEYEKALKMLSQLPEDYQPI